MNLTERATATIAALALFAFTGCNDKTGRSAQTDPSPSALTAGEIAKFGLALTSQVALLDPSFASEALAPAAASCADGGSSQYSPETGTTTYTDCSENGVTKNGAIKTIPISEDPITTRVEYVDYRESAPGSCGSSELTQNGKMTLASTFEGPTDGTAPVRIRSSGPLEYGVGFSNAQGTSNYSASGNFNLDSTIVFSAGNITQALAYTAALIVNDGSLTVEASGTIYSPDNCTISSPTSELTYKFTGQKVHTLKIQMHCKNGTKIFLNDVEVDRSCI